jgi:hypothetical protein
MTPGTDRDVARQTARRHLAQLVALLEARAGEPGVDQVIEYAAHLERAIAAFHMEAIRFRIFTIDRFIRSDPASDDRTRRVLAELKAALEAAGFQTSSKGL